MERTVYKHEGHCSVEGCERDARVRGKCRRHYDSWWRTEAAPTCVEPGCNNRGGEGAKRCAKHYREFREATSKDRCRVEGCDRAKAHTGGLCQAHREREKKGLEISKPWARESVGEWGAWRFRKRDGYVHRSRTVDGRQEFELQHRRVVEDALGRKLLAAENVHHKNGNRADNRLENLELWNTHQPSGQRIKDKLAWAHEIIALYEEGGTWKLTGQS